MVKKSVNRQCALEVSSGSAMGSWQEFTGFVVDSRNVEPNNAFFALPGNNSDGHNFVNNAINNGASCVVITKNFYNNHIFHESLNCLIVDDVYECLYKLAMYIRIQYTGKLIAITGSIGKTTTKHLIFQVLSSYRKCDTNIKNYNSKIGIPLSISNIDFESEIFIQEVGIDRAGDMEHLSCILKPDIAVVLNVSDAHSANYPNEQITVIEKLKIASYLADNGILLVNADNAIITQSLPNIKEICNNKHTIGKLYTFGVRGDIIKLNKCIIQEFGTEVSIKIDNQELQYRIQSFHKGHVYGTLVTFALLKTIEVKDFYACMNVIENFQPLAGRGKIYKLNIGDKNIKIIDESYNANTKAMILAAEAFINTPCKGKRIAVIGDMMDLHQEKSYEKHKLIAKYFQDIDFVITVGIEMEAVRKEFSSSKHFCEYSKTICHYLIDTIIDNGDMVLIKGSRGMHLDLLIEDLMELAI